MVAIAQRLQTIRDLMQQHDIDFYYVPSSDAHQNEYVPTAWQRRAWVSGFTGSAGDVLIGKDKAYLWTDGRYFLQAEQQLGQDFTLMKQSQGQAAPIDQWLQKQGQELRVAVDPKVLSIGQAMRMQAALEPHGGALVAFDDNWVDVAKGDVMALPCEPVSILDEQYTGESTRDKLERIRSSLDQYSADAIAFNMLDEIAWVLNLRGCDIDFNPVFISYLLVTQDHATLFIDADKLDDDVRRYLKSCGVSVLDYDALAESAANFNGVILLDPASASWWMHGLFHQATLCYQRSPVVLFKACKNDTEKQGMREAHRLDALAEVKFMHWIESHWSQGLTEWQAAQKLEAFRRESDLCVGLSFNTISGFASNGAIIHYACDQESAKTIDDSDMYLLDSGGQYLCGTTDITRTMHFGVPTGEHKRHYTLVLKGHLALSHMVFAHGTSGMHLDAIARQFLWAEDLDYAHGTGHGVGCHLCVHEGPIAIRRAGGSEPLLPGMVVSNEPGVYFDGEYGIRIENLLLVRQHQHVNASGHGPFYCFEDLVLVPYARNLIDVALLTVQERQQVNDYHAGIVARLSGDLNAEQRRWLEQACLPI